MHTMSDEKQNKNKNPFDHFWDMATGGLLSSFSDSELIPNKNAGKKKNQTRSKNGLKTRKPIPVRDNVMDKDSKESQAST